MNIHRARKLASGAWYQFPKGKRAIDAELAEAFAQILLRENVRMMNWCIFWACIVIGLLARRILQ